jgi:predicted ATPase
MTYYEDRDDSSSKKKISKGLPDYTVPHSNVSDLTLTDKKTSKKVLSTVRHNQHTLQTLKWKNFSTIFDYLQAIYIIPDNYFIQ